MISKHIVLSMIVIGFLVQFITCPSSVNNNTPNKQNGASKPSSSKPSSSNTQQGNSPQGAKKSGASPATKTGTQPRGLENGNPKNNGKVEDPKTSAKKPTRSKQPEASNNQNKNIDSIPENQELEEEKPTGRIRKAFNMFNGFRRKFCPFRLFGKVVKKTKELGTNMIGTVMNTIKSKSTNDNDADGSSQNNA